MVLVVLFCLIFMARSRGTGHIVSQVNLCIIVCDVRLHSLLIEGFNTVYHNWLHPRPARAPPTSYGRGSIRLGRTLKQTASISFGDTSKELNEGREC